MGRESPPPQHTHTHLEGSLTPVFSSSEADLGGVLKGRLCAQSQHVLGVVGCVGAALTWSAYVHVRFGGARAPHFLGGITFPTVRARLWVEQG